MKRLVILALMTIIGTSMLSACGKKGKLIPPKEWKKAEAPQPSRLAPQEHNG